MAQKLSDSVVRALPLPQTGQVIAYDSKVAGFGIRITAAGARSFILNYRTKLGRRAPLHHRHVPGLANRSGAGRSDRTEEAD